MDRGSVVIPPATADLDFVLFGGELWQYLGNMWAIFGQIFLEFYIRPTLNPEKTHPHRRPERNVLS